MQFKRNVPKPETQTKSNIPWKRIVLSLFMFLIALVSVGYVGWQAMGLYQRVSGRWQEIVFAYNKPELVRGMRVDYVKRQEDLDRSFLKKEKTAEEKLLEEVANQLRATPSKFPAQFTQ